MPGELQEPPPAGGHTSQSGQMVLEVVVEMVEVEVVEVMVEVMEVEEVVLCCFTCSSPSSFRECPCGPTLKRFGGRAQEFSPRARLRHWMG